MSRSRGYYQHGVSLVLAIFVLVVMSVLAAALMNILAVGSDTVAREVVSSRALMAAHSGAQRKLSEIFPAGGAINMAACQAEDYNFASLLGCSNAIISCSSVTVESVSYFTVRSTGRCGPAAAPAVRVIEVQAKGV